MDQVEEFRVHRLIWMSKESFLITGLDKNLKFKRIHLRLGTSSDAAQSASAIVSQLGIREEPLATVEEFRVQARFPFSVQEIVLQSPLAVFRFIIWIIVIQIVAALDILGPIIAWLLVIGSVGVWIWATVHRGRMRFEAVLRLGKTSLELSTSADFAIVIPRVLQWEGPETFLLSGAGRKVQIYLPTSEEAVQLVSKIQAGFPGVRVIMDPKGSTSIRLGQTP